MRAGSVNHDIIERELLRQVFQQKLLRGYLRADCWNKLSSFSDKLDAYSKAYTRELRSVKGEVRSLSSRV